MIFIEIDNLYFYTIIFFVIGSCLVARLTLIIIIYFRYEQKPSAPLTLIDHMWMGGSKVLAACDYVGEKLAAALGITTPKYSYEIEQIKKMQKEREKAIVEETSTGGWMQQTLDTQFKPADKQNSIARQPIAAQNGLQKY